ncbi:bifunctional phosphopantothenoylcysteine decarboxylase/phosphopantothenate--cysteine ligase CoaBC [Spiroplasma endosymbiont of Monopis laevigella]|uniref:bifunctional phosphopantothenoylcysteine decarboxylase/phosphopantothenate--cysteine ligase CoaBC n=1 Tax=Spiroplasma endosymbiont of Monopis laevigella TaxID=3066312 RepID=UPI0030CB379F
MKHITLIITGSIAANKALILLKQLKKEFLVDIICTKSSLHFLEDKTFSYYSEMFEQESYVKVDLITHTNLAIKTNLIVVYPATMSFISKANLAIADSLALSVFLASKAEKILFPAMNHNMYHNQSFQKNLLELSNFENITIIPPDSGMLACKMIGDGRVKSPDNALAIIKDFFKKNIDLSDKKILINIGRTRTYIDPIRYITNNSSGKMGKALVDAFLKTNAKVVLVAGDCDFEIKSQKNLTIIKANTNEKMFLAMKENFDNADIVICAAALNDYKVSKYIPNKIIKNKNENLSLSLIANIDVLAFLGKQKAQQVLIGFAAQEVNDKNLGIEKMKIKNCDGICINNISVMGKNETEINFYFKNNNYNLIGSKVEVAKQIVDIISKNILNY